MARSLGFFNNKGGVGKTTLACNMASLLAEELSIRVLVVDCDPQCNATQLLLTDEQWDNTYNDPRASQRKTILKLLRHITAGDSSIDPEIAVQTSTRFGCDVLPGHPWLASIEDRLSSAWVGFLGGDLGGARKSIWASSLVDGSEYDLLIFDVGPSLGALNRTVLLGCDRFITPMAADLFSLYALDNIGDWIKNWIRAYRRGFDSIYEEQRPDIDEYGVGSEPRTASAFAGYTVQQYVTKNTGGQLRKVNAYDRYKREIPKRAAALADLSPSEVSDLDLGVVPNMFSMVPLAQAVHAPIAKLTIQDGLRGGAVNQQARYAERLIDISKRLIANTGLLADSDK